MGAFSIEGNNLNFSSLIYCTLARITNVLELLNTQILFIIDNRIKISNETLFDILTYLQSAQEKIKFLQLESQLHQDELQHKTHNFEPVIV